MADTSTTLSQSSEVIDYPPGRRPYEYKPILMSRPLPSSHHLSHSASSSILNAAFVEPDGSKNSFTDRRISRARLWRKCASYFTRMERILLIRRALLKLFEGRFRASSTKYAEFPSKVRPLRNNILPIVEPDPRIQRCNLVLRDNATWEVSSLLLELSYSISGMR